MRSTPPEALPLAADPLHQPNHGGGQPRRAYDRCYNAHVTTSRPRLRLRDLQRRGCCPPCGKCGLQGRPGNRAPRRHPLLPCCQTMLPGKSPIPMLQRLRYKKSLSCYTSRPRGLSCCPVLYYGLLYHVGSTFQLTICTMLAVYNCAFCILPTV